MRRDEFSSRIISWYGQNKRDLPWRSVADPYKIWLSEIILQQTRVNQGLPYYHEFIRLFPTVSDLAMAEEKEVLRAWQGLGYYSRARNLHKCANFINENLGGIFPKTYEQLLKLPGIGPYTAAAIASFAYGEKVAVVDGNVFRVLARVYGMADDIATGKGQKAFQKKANEVIPSDRPAIYNQAVMEFGALHCTPANPDCLNCVFNIECHARIHHQQSFLPVKTKKLKIRKRYFNYLVLNYEGKIMLKERKDKDIWLGLYDFPLIEDNINHSANSLITNSSFKKLNLKDLLIEESQQYKHILSHQHIYAKFFMMEVDSTEVITDEAYGFYNQDEILDLPKPVLISSYLNETVF